VCRMVGGQSTSVLQADEEHAVDVEDHTVADRSGWHMAGPNRHRARGSLPS
jgi:hypothetical protein